MLDAKQRVRVVKSFFGLSYVVLFVGVDKSKSAAKFRFFRPPWHSLNTIHKRLYSEIFFSLFLFC